MRFETPLTLSALVSRADPEGGHVLRDSPRTDSQRHTALENRPARSQGISMKLCQSKLASGQSYVLALRCGRRADMFSRMRRPTSGPS